jgi:hypothetical protein
MVAGPSLASRENPKNSRGNYVPAHRERMKLRTGTPGSGTSKKTASLTRSFYLLPFTSVRNCSNKLLSCSCGPVVPSLITGQNV